MNRSRRAARSTAPPNIRLVVAGFTVECIRIARRGRQPRGFTLVELLVVIAIIGILIAMLLPAVQAARESARRAQCQNNLKQVALAAHNFHSAFGKFPPQYGWRGSPTHGAFGSLFFQLLPFIEQNNLYDRAQIAATTNQSYPCNYTQAPGTHDSRMTLGGEQVPDFICPSEASQPYVLPNWGWGGSNYAGNFQVFGTPNKPPPAIVSCCDDNNLAVWKGGSKLGRSFADGTSNTLLFVEKFANCNSTGPYPGTPDGGCMWARWDWSDYWQPTFAAFVTGPSSMFQEAPYPDTKGGPCNPRVAQTPHSGIMNVALADGSVRSINAATDANLWWALCTPATGEVLPDF